MRFCRKSNLNPQSLIKRVIHINQQTQDLKYCSNRISTSKYNVLSFIPKFVFEQARKYSNIFFFLIVLLQQIPDVSPTGRYTTAVPWVFILSVSAIKEIVEDIKRTVSDRQLNNRKIKIFKENDWKVVRWKDVKVGDFVKIEAGELFPADLFLISSSEPNSICYIQTANLDGETNLKIRQGLPLTHNILNNSNIKDIKATIECEPPNKDLYKFSGLIDTNDGIVTAIDANQILLRGSQLRNTKWIFGLVIYTGHDTKLMKNSNSPPFKRSHVEKVTNKQILALFGILLVICFISTGASAIWNRFHGKNHWYLGFKDETYNSIPYTFLTFIVLYNNLIPISLQVTLELVKFLQAYFINYDTEMYDEESEFSAIARTSNLNEELGQIQYVFSDKTGTLTCNQMDFKRCSIAGVCYGSGNHEEFNGYEMLNNLDKQHRTVRYIEEFLCVLGTCHTVIPEMSDDGEINYQASSPDENAIINCMKSNRVVFKTRSPQKLNLEFNGEERVYEILNVLEFNSVRKRLSIILRDHKGNLKLYCKGADNVIIPRLSDEQSFKEITLDHVEEFARDGLRTLLICYKDLNETEYQNWNQLYHKAATSLINRDFELQEIAELIEKDMFLLGATGIEDKLQKGVPETISMLLKATIKFWILTGDKMETAVNIGYSSKLLNESTHLVYLVDDSSHELLRIMSENCNNMDDKNKKKLLIGLIIDASILNILLSDICCSTFLKLSTNSQSVIICRATPANKAEMVEFIKKQTKCITLAIGDGANDVGMIQAAHVGVGIYGKEGSQALSASDYAIGQFRFLQRLLFVHGIWNYKRLCKVILYSFYKNVCLYVIELWYALSNGYSGQILFERWLISLYNLLFTSAPPMALGLFDRPLKAATMLNFPELYKSTQSRSDFNIKVFWAWIANSVVHSILLYYIVYGILSHDVALSNGQAGDFLFMGNFVYTYCVVVVCLKSGLETDSWTVMTFLSIFGSILFWFFYMVVYSKVYPKILIGAEMSGMASHVLSSGLFWFGLLFVPIIVLLPDVAYKVLQRTLFKNTEQQVQEKEKEDIDPSPVLRKKINATTKLLRQVFSFNKTKPTEPYRGFAFSQEERGVVRQADLVRQYNTERPAGNLSNE